MFLGHDNFVGFNISRVQRLKKSNKVKNKNNRTINKRLKLRKKREKVKTFTLFDI